MHTLANAIQVRDAARALLTKLYDIGSVNLPLSIWKEADDLAMALVRQQENPAPVVVLAMEDGDD